MDTNEVQTYREEVYNFLNFQRKLSGEKKKTKL